jgi:hypothetical protein
MKKKIQVVLDPQLIFDDAQMTITHNNSLMMEAIEAHNLKDAIKYASKLTQELRNPSLGVKDYYVLCKVLSKGRYECV